MRAFTANNNNSSLAAVLIVLFFMILTILTVFPTSTTANQFYTHGRYGKRVPGPFGHAARMWSLNSNNIGRRRVEIEPRADKFFLNSRYGKRTSELIEPVPVLPSAASITDENNNMIYLACHYTGINDLFRCSENRLKAASDENSSSSSPTSSSSDQDSDQQITP